MTYRATRNVRYETTRRLVEDHGWPPKEASAWANSTADSPDEIRRWRDAKYNPQQAQVIYAAADHEPTAWRDLDLPVDVTVAYVEAGCSFDEVLNLEDNGERPNLQTFNVMRAFNRDNIDEAISEFKEDLRTDSEIADLLEDY